MALRFRCEPEMIHLPISFRRVLALWKSRSDVDVALEGHSSQPASLFVCLYSPQKDQRGMVVAFHLKQSDRLVFYRYVGDMNRPRSQWIDDAALFAESLGFLLDDLSYGARDDTSRERLW